MHNPILADLATQGFRIEVRHENGLTAVRLHEPKTDRAFSARAENEFMATLFAKGKLDLGLADEPARRAAA